MATKTTAAAKEAEAVETTNATAEAVEKALAQPEIVQLVYIGPNMPKAMLQSNKIFEGTEEEIKKALAGVIEKFPLVEKMLVRTSELADKKDKVKTAGNIYNKYYADLQAASLAYLDKEV